jgi:hypothetical protein
MKISDVYPSNSPCESAGDYEGTREQCQITEVKMETVLKPDGTQDSYLYCMTDSDKFEKGIKINRTCAKMLGAEFGNDTKTWIGRTVNISTMFYPKFKTFGWIVDPDYQANRQAQANTDDMENDSIPF